MDEQAVPNIRVIGPRDQGLIEDGYQVVDTTSKSVTEWTTQLSPFFLGPCWLYAEHVARRLENAWQFSKVYPDQLDPSGEASAAYWAWAKAGWASSGAVRYPRGKGAKPAFLLWHGQKLGYVEGRLRVYWMLYRDAVARTHAFARLQETVASGQKLALFDFDGYDHDRAGVPLRDVLLDDRRPMGHAFVLKAMLLHGSHVSPQEVLNAAPRLQNVAADAQLALL